jgi:hypothetical protein
MANRNKANPDRVAALERYRKALELRKAGASYTAIARECGFSRQRAHQVVQDAIRSVVREAAMEVLKLELERLDRMLFGIWEQARNGKFEAIDRVLRIMDRRRALYGWDRRPPIALQTDLEGMSPELAARIMRAATSNGGPPPEGGEGEAGLVNVHKSQVHQEQGLPAINGLQNRPYTIHAI